MLTGRGARAAPPVGAQVRGFGTLGYPPLTNRSGQPIRARLARAGILYEFDGRLLAVADPAPSGPSQLLQHLTRAVAAQQLGSPADRTLLFSIVFGRANLDSSTQQAFLAAGLLGGCGSTLFGGLFSLPGMMCTCCAAPLAVGLRKKQVSPGAALAFWLGNPTLNPATILFMVFVLPWPFAVLRVVFGILLVFGVSYAANRLSGPTVLPEAIEKQQEERLQASEGPLLLRWLKTVWSLTLHIVPAYVIAVLVLGATRAWLPSGLVSK
ncbi:MAG: permease [Alicyclobacillus sp.]|nr:permease [Alicyclobacillus sp.]